MKAARTLFEAKYGELGCVTLNMGAPGPATLKKCSQLMRKATEARLVQEETENDSSLLQYGPPRGDPLFISQLARFLTAEYGAPVDPSNLITTAGASSGLHYLLTTLFPGRCPIFVEEVTYFLALGVFKDLNYPIVPVAMDSDGLNVDDLISQIQSAKRIAGNSSFPVPDHGYWAILYTMPIFHNPTGRCLSPEKSKRLVQVAGENRILIISEDVYNLLYFDGDVPPKRLFAYDQERRKISGTEDAKDGGCVISNCTFSKLLTPGLRLGWWEAPTWIAKIWDTSTTVWSGGCLNEYTCGVVGKGIEMGLVTEFIHQLRTMYKKRRDLVVAKLKDILPDSCRIESPKGGYFIWLQLPKELKAATVQEMAKEKHKILFLKGRDPCVPERADKFENCIRLAFSYHDEDILVENTGKLASVIKDCIQRQEQSTKL